MALQIEKVPLSSARKATKVLQLCLKFQLKEQGTHVPTIYVLTSPPSLSLSPAQNVCRVMSMREFRSGRLGAALSWCLRAKDAVFAAYLAEKLVLLVEDCGAVGTLSSISDISPATRAWERSWTLTSWTTSEPLCSSVKS